MAISGIGPIDRVGLVNFLPPVNWNKGWKQTTGVSLPTKPLPHSMPVSSQPSNPLAWQADSFYSIYNFLIYNNQVQARQANTLQGEAGCQSCQNRVYVCSNGETTDGQATTIPGRQSALRVSHHEAQHLRLARLRAEQEGKVIIGQEIKLFSAVCPECGQIYVNQGQAISKSISKEDFSALLSSNKCQDIASISNKKTDERLEGKGMNLDLYG